MVKRSSYSSHMVSCEEGTSEIAPAIVETNEITLEKEETYEIAEAIVETNEIAEAKEETYETAESKTAKADQIRRKLTKFKEENGVAVLKRLFVKKMIDMQEKATGGDVFLFWIDENGFESAQRANALDAKLRVLHRECGKISLEWYINRMSVGAVDTLAAKLGLFSNEYAMLFGECAKSAAELCIKKMRLGALVGKLEKRTILEREIAGAKRMKKEQAEKLRTFQKNSRVNELARKQDSQAYDIDQENDVEGAVMDGKQTEISKGKIRFEALSDEIGKIVKARKMGMMNEVAERLMDIKRNVRANELARKQDSQAHAIAQQNDVGGAVMDGKPTEIARGKLKKMDSALCDEDVRNMNEVKGSAFVKEGLRVLMEMMKGVKCGEKRSPRVDEAIALADAWTMDRIDLCVVRVCLGVLVDKHSISEVLKSEIAENWKMEKEVKDRLVKYQRKYGHHPHAQGFSTDSVVKKKNSVVKKKNSDKRKVLGLVWQQMSLFACGAVAGIIAGSALAKAWPRKGE